MTSRPAKPLPAEPLSPGLRDLIRALARAQAQRDYAAMTDPQTPPKA